MTDADPFAAWQSDTDRYEQFTEAARRLLREDPELRQAHRAWTEFVVESHGDVFERMAVPDPRERVFADALYYDFAVGRLLAAAEAAFDFEVANPQCDADALGVDFGALGRRVAEAADLAVDTTDLAVDAAPGSDPSTDDAPGEPDTANPLTREALLDADVDALRNLYESVVSREVRLALGEYYTPRGVADLAIETLSVEGPRETFLDPGCGSGAFLAAAIDAKRDLFPEDVSPGATVDLVTDTVFGVDLNPVAVRSAKLGYVLALLPELAAADVGAVEIPVYLADALELTRERGPPTGDGGLPTDEDGAPAVDHLVGNPPWVTWTDLTERVRAAWREVADDRLDLLPHDGAESRLGHANDDVSLPFAWVCLHRYLAGDGDAAFVLKRDVMKGPAGKLLRTQRVGDRSVPVRFVHDFTDLRPFGEQVDASAAVYAFAADDDSDSDSEFPIPATAWTRRRDAGGYTPPDFSSAAAMRETLAREETGFVPVQSDDPTSAWIRRDAERAALGTCDHRVRHGLKDDAKAVFSVDRDDLDRLDADLVYPYLRSKHVVKYGLFGHDLHLVPMEQANEDNEAELRRQYPATYEYLRDHRERLEARSSSWLDEGPFYNLFGLGEYTWADYKVVWCRLGFKPNFAVVSTVEDPDIGEKPVVPGDHCMFVATDDAREAHFLTALLNSAPYQKSLRDVASEGKASLSKTTVSKLSLPEYEATSEQDRLADLSMQAHEIVPEYTDVSKREFNRTTIPELEAVQADIDELVEELLAAGALGATEDGDGSSS